MTNPYDIEFCQDCHRPKARSANDAAIGFCDKSRAFRDPEADKDCALFKEARLKRLAPNDEAHQRRNER